MKIQVTKHMTMNALQHEFSRYFPYLSLSFYSKSHDIYESNPVKYLITECHIPLERIELHPHDAVVAIQKDMTVAVLEQLFETEFGLHVQVLRRHGSGWTETTLTDNLSLQEQNDLALKPQDNNPDALPIDYPFARTEWYLG